MRLTILAFAMLPCAAMAQSTPQMDTPQSCPVGMVWDADAQTCAMAADDASPLDGLPDRSGCQDNTARELTA